MYETISFYINAQCGVCGETLKFSSKNIDSEITIYPELCPVCFTEDREESYQRGLFDGVEEGRMGG